MYTNITIMPKSLTKIDENVNKIVLKKILKNEKYAFFRKIIH